MADEDAAIMCPAFAPFFGFAGATFAMVFSSIGAAYGTAKSGVGIAGMGQFKPALIMKALIPVVMASIIGVYGLVVAVLISGSIESNGRYSLFQGLVHMGSGMTTGFAGLAAGVCVGTVGDAAVRAYAFQTKVFVGMVLILIFAEVLGLYGLIVSLILNAKTNGASC